MNKEEVKLVIHLVGIIAKYGVPAVKNFIEYIEKEKITKEDIDNLMLEKNPEDFFK